MEEADVNDAQTLKNLRTEAGLDIAQLAAMANLSPGQVRQLEEGGDSNFYSPQIKAQSMRRVLRMLLNQPSSAETQEVLEHIPKSGNVIDNIIRLSEKNQHTTLDTSLARRSGNPLKLTLGLGVLLALVFVVLNWQDHQDKPKKILAEWVQPLATSPDVKPTEPLESAPPEGVKSVTDNVLPVVVATPPPAPVAEAVAPPPAKTAPVAITAKEHVSDCKQLTSEPAVVAPVSINKAGTYVYLLASKDMQVCVDDGKRVSSVVNLKAGEGKSIHGASPWVIGATDMAALQVYFQGAKVFIPKEAGSRILLKEQALPS